MKGKNHAMSGIPTRSWKTKLMLMATLCWIGTAESATGPEAFAYKSERCGPVERLKEEAKNGMNPKIVEQPEFLVA